MKKIFTLIFSLGLLTSAFAQSDHGKNDQKPMNSHYSPTGYQENHDMKKGTNTYSYDNNSQWNEKNKDGQYAYNDRNEYDRKLGDRDKHYDPKFDKKERDTKVIIQPRKPSLFQVVLNVVLR